MTSDSLPSFLSSLIFCNDSAARFSFVSFLFFLFLVNAGLLCAFHAKSSLLYVYHSYLSKKKKKNRTDPSSISSIKLNDAHS